MIIIVILSMRPYESITVFIHNNAGCVVPAERNRRSGRQLSMSTRRMVALYDYDPRESSPNVDVEVPLPQ